MALQGNKAEGRERSDNTGNGTSEARVGPWEVTAEYIFSGIS